MDMTLKKICDKKGIPWFEDIADMLGFVADKWNKDTDDSMTINYDKVGKRANEKKGL